MFIYVGEDEAMTLGEVDHLRSLKLVASLSNSDTLSHALAKANSVHTGEHAWISIPWLRQHAQVASDNQWQHQFDETLKYADKQGWVDSANQRVRVHIEWSTPATANQ